MHPDIDVNARRSEDNKSALFVAAERGQRYGSEPESKVNSPMHIHRRIAEALLVGADTDVNERNHANDAEGQIMTPIAAAIANKQVRNVVAVADALLIIRPAIHSPSRFRPRVFFYGAEISI